MEQSTQQAQQHPLANYQFSSEELKVLRECNTESFFQRSLPLSTALGVGAYLAVKSGYLQPNFKYGAVPKVVVGVIIGYFLGKFSYQQKCAEKLMRLPNSRLGELLKQRRKDGGVMGRLNPDQGMGIGLGLNPFNSTLSSTNEDLGRELPRSSALNLDVETRPSIAGLDDIYRPTLDNPSPFYETDVPIDQAKHGLSYEELRKKNREEYEKKQQNPYSRPLSANAPVVIRENEALKAPFGSDSNTSTSTRGHKNKYGDTWTD
ncbi:PREDICTED: OCIA domain-containing protein 1 [Rhagoletis zephyria]|uniref:OCIA domain-containing protein 1 n=1 Tax=Rhagoletis zephyria TaxID=28612 RepID=UPI000811394D|nr:PREDICTED: OCIA domain-containing protein 1 [Rhagoletis zephyria]XP_017469268.1 PREDICTED: OCIA domain-containing protein 1 [Rhagoletis zephyria]